MRFSWAHAAAALRRIVADDASRQLAEQHLDEAMLWGSAAGRCQFDGCNRPLWKSPVTQERVNLAEKAHIYSFSADGPRGNRGVDARRLNALENLILFATSATRRSTGTGAANTATPLLSCSNGRLPTRSGSARVTGIGPEKNSHILLFGSNIGDHHGPLHYTQAVGAVFPHWYPEQYARLNWVYGTACSRKPRRHCSGTRAHENLETDYEHVPWPSGAAVLEHLSVFALAAQPLLIGLGALLGDIVRAEVYQLQREPAPSWKWPAQAPVAPAVEIRRPVARRTGRQRSCSHSARRSPSIGLPRFSARTPRSGRLTVPSPHKEIVKSPAQLLRDARALQPNV